MLNSLVLLRLWVELDLLKVFSRRFDQVFLLVNDGVHIGLHEFLDIRLATIVYLILEALIHYVLSTVNVILLYQAVLDQLSILVLCAIL